MKFGIISMAIIAASIASPTISSAQAAGEFALAQWQGGPKWYPGTVLSRSGNSVRIQYDDGSQETRPSNQVRRYNWQRGSQLECKWSDGAWYAAVITAMGSDMVSLTVRYEDGTVEQTITTECRSN